MKLILHDLTPEMCETIGLTNLLENEYMMINALEIDKYCIGCFGCWLKTPGKCVIKDNFQTMGINLSKVNEFVIITKATFGSYSSAVKNVLDRSIGYVMPFFEIRGGEMHHAERYDNDLRFSAYIYGDDITELEKETYHNVVKANALNLNSTIGDVKFFDSFEDVKEVFA